MTQTLAMDAPLTQTTPNQRRHTWLIMLSGLVCLLIFTVTIPLPRVDGHLIGSDGLSYYAILRSAFFDQDFNYTNDYALLGTQYIVSSSTMTTQGVPSNPFALGSALLWFPFFLLAHGVSLVLSLAGMPVPLNGTGYIYEAAVCYGTIIYATLGFVLAYHLASRLVAARNAFLATIALWWCSQALYYIVSEPSMSHGITIFTMALFLWRWYPPTAQRTLRDWLILGAVTGLVALGRWQDGIVVLIPIAELVWGGATGRRSWRDTALASFAFFTMLLIVFSPQLFMWKAVYGAYLTIPQGNDFLTWGTPHILETLFSTRHGLLTWHPILLLALVGLIPLWKRTPVLTLAILYILLTQLYVNSAVARWWADDAFGGRRFISAIPLFILLLAAFVQTINVRSMRYVYVSIVLLFIWNGLSFAQYRLGYVSKDAALTAREMTIDRVTLPWQLIKRVLE